jgi:hypothetical protein
MFVDFIAQSKFVTGVSVALSVAAFFVVKPRLPRPPAVSPEHFSRL